jgi:hypothetical protein
MERAKPDNNAASGKKISLMKLAVRFGLGAYDGRTAMLCKRG